METKTQLEQLKRRIPFDVDVFGNKTTYEMVLEDLLEDSKNICLSILYPFCDDFAEVELPKRFDNWQLRACVELYNLADKTGIINYTENGISWSKLSDGLSIHLLNAITPKVGTPKRTKLEEESVVENV